MKNGLSAGNIFIGLGFGTEGKTCSLVFPFVRLQNTSTLSQHHQQENF